MHKRETKPRLILGVAPVETLLLVDRVQMATSSRKNSVFFFAKWGFRGAGWMLVGVKVSRYVRL